MTERNIRSVSSFVKSLWDWTFLNPCFEGTRIRVSDIDGIVERKGHFLWIEVKPERNDDTYEVPRGQRYMHEALQRTGCFTVVTVWGHTDTDVASEYLARSDTTAMLCALGQPYPTYMRVMYETGHQIECKTNREEFFDFVQRWFKWANENPKTSHSQQAQENHP